MKKLLTILLIIFSISHVYAQERTPKDIPFPATYVINADTATLNIYLSDSFWQMVADPSGKMDLKQAMQPGAFTDTIRKIDTKNNVFWIRYRLANNMQKEAKITLRVNADGYSTSRSDLYIKSDNGKWNHLKTGHGVPWSERDGLKRFYYINVIIPAGEGITVYQRDMMDNLFYPDVAYLTKVVSFGFTETLVNIDYIDDDFHYIPAIEKSFLLGLLVLAIAINLYFFITVREKEFLYFTLFLVTAAINCLNNLPDVILREYPRLQNYLTFFSIFSYFFLIFFIRHFLKTFNRFPSWDRWLKIAAALLVVNFSLLASTVAFGRRPPDIYQTLIIVIFTISFISLLVTFLLFIRSRDKAVRLMIIAVSPLVILFMLTLLAFVVIQIVTYATGNQSVSDFMAPVWGNFSSFQDISYVWMVLVFSWVLFIRFSSLRKKVAMQEVEKERERNALIAQQKIELEKQVTKRTAELKQSLENLKSTQSQLIQSEKMASLGELTAGIAHEIQNPLNFVNNFSEINTELIEEANQEIDNGNVAEAKTILNDVKDNSEKINHHGKRADAIVKGMLQHSRTSTGVKEPTDINALADEYLRLSYHGMRAKDKSFNCEMKTEFDESLQKINVVPQDIGRVLLNLFNNAFYACAERSRSTAVGHPPIGVANGYKPTVSVTIKKPLDHITITVTDNGNGIPEKIKDKIFQPFFTTKPAGQGTGLGLSLSYDIITKEHNGTIKVESREGEGTEFIVTIPVKSN